MGLVTDAHPFCVPWGLGYSAPHRGFAMNEEDLQEIENELLAPRRHASAADTRAVSTGSTLLNLALTGDAFRGFSAGRYFLYVGSSGSGKTFMCLTCFAEAANSPEFSGYDLIHYDVEDGSLMDFEQFFGKAVARRVQAPRYDRDGNPEYPETIEAFYAILVDRLEQVKAGKAKPFIMVLDSMDALTSDSEVETFKHNKKVEMTGTGKKKSDYGDGKAKVNSRNIRKVTNLLSATGCILLVICQTRDNLDDSWGADDEVHAGGRALKFYAGAQVWTSHRDIVVSTPNDTKRQVGISTKLRIKKNRITGKNWTVDVPIYWSHGIDDIGSCIAFLKDEKAIGGAGGVYTLQIDGTTHKVKGEDNLVRYIEDNNLEDGLRRFVQETWNGVEEACRVVRKRRYE